MKKILVLSDSHSAMSFMRMCVNKISPTAIIHLGDHFDDGEALHEEFPYIPFFQVAGNCDRYRTPPHAREILNMPLYGVRIYMTHGHIHRVKAGLGALIADARKIGVQAVLFGHTHQSCCVQEEDGLWVINPGSCGSYGGSAALIEAVNGKITACRILRQADLDQLTETEKTPEP